MIRNDVDINSTVSEHYKENITEYTVGRLNKTSHFVLPMIDLSTTGAVISRYLRNAFLDDEGIEHDFTRPVFLLFRVKNPKDKPWTDFCKASVNRDAYITDYYVGRDSDNADLIMFVFQVPEKWSDDFEFYKIGRYSLTSKEYKNKFPEFVFTPSGAKRETRAWGILNKSETLKDEVVKHFINPGTSKPEDVISLRREMNTWDEIWDKPMEKEEIFRYIAK
jgi:hypothetical protein